MTQRQRHDRNQGELIHEPGAEPRTARLHPADAALRHGGNQMMVRLLASSRTGEPGDDVAARIRAELGGGRPLPATVRADVEHGLGQRLGDVRLHTDAAAAGLATELGARAFTTGNDIFFNSGAYSPSTTEGYTTLAHELTHTVQQADGPVAGRQVSRDLAVSHPNDHDELHAQATAETLTAQRDMATAAAPPGPAPAPRTGGPISVQRHSSFEHTLLGNTPPDQLSDAAVKPDARAHVLGDLWQQMQFFAADPTADPRARFPDIRWVQFKESKLWASYGELNALADYLPNPGTADVLPAAELIPVLQKMRGGIRRDAATRLNFPDSSDSLLAYGGPMTGAASSALESIPGAAAAGEVVALDDATAKLGTDRYKGLLSRNACHFAPFSWQRWEQHHNEAAEEAKAHFRWRTTPAPLKDVPVGAEEHLRQAVLKNGYADHFLEDSFAAGHLINKTLVMQWWVDYLNQRGNALVGGPDADVLRRMGTTAQPGVSGRGLYAHRPEEGNIKWDDWKSGTGVTDPQSAQERATHEGRVGGSGVSGADAADLEANYQAYLRLLNNAQAQGVAGATHDWFNSLGLTVVSSDGSVQMRVGGDDTLLSQSDAAGAAAAASAAFLSRQRIDELLASGTTSISMEAIFALVPAKVVIAGVPEPVPLGQWQQDYLKDLCFDVIFPDYYNSVKATVIGAAGAEMVSGGMSKDSESGWSLLRALGLSSA